MINRWYIDDLLENGFEEDLKSLSKDLEKLDFIYNNLSKDMSLDDFSKYYLEIERIYERYSKISSYSSLLEDMNSKDNIAKKYSSKLKVFDVRFSEISNKISHFLVGLKCKGKDRLDLKNAQRLFSSIPNVYYSLLNDYKNSKYSLSLDKENIIDNKDLNGIEVVLNLYELITSEFSYNFLGNDLNTSKLTKYFKDFDPSVRENAYSLMLNKYKDNIDKLYLIYEAIVRDLNYEKDIRGYKDAISIRNKSNNISDKCVNNLIDVCIDNTNIYQDFFKIKAKKIGVEKIRRYDIYSPINIDKSSIDLDLGVREVLSAMNNFSPKFYSIAKSIIDKNHIDYLPFDNKRGGAYCSAPTRENLPYILLNYNNQLEDVFTLSHELGHAIHDVYSSKNNFTTFSPPLTLAETASTFCENILFDYLFEKSSQSLKEQMLFDYMSSSYATIIRQNYFVNFELSAHKIIPNGSDYEEVCNLYFSNLNSQFGSSVDVSSNFRYEWSYIPHIFNSPFYCYSYNFGELLSMTLYDRYKSEGEDFIPVIEDILSSGGSKRADDLLNEHGFNINSKSFWNIGFKVVKNRLKDLKSL